MLLLLTQEPLQYALLPSKPPSVPNHWLYMHLIPTIAMDSSSPVPHICCVVCVVCTLQYDQNLAGPALDYVAGDAARLSDPLVSPVLADYGNGRPFPATLIQVGGTAEAGPAVLHGLPLDFS